MKISWTLTAVGPPVPFIVSCRFVAEEVAAGHLIDLPVGKARITVRHVVATDVWWCGERDRGGVWWWSDGVGG